MTSTSASASTGTDPQGRPLRQALDPVASPSPYLSSLTSAANGTLSIAKEVLMGSLQSEYRRSESVRILSDRECSTDTTFSHHHGASAHRRIGASHRTILIQIHDCVYYSIRCRADGLASFVIIVVVVAVVVVVTPPQSHPT
jgi:hypothetical protein